MHRSEKGIDKGLPWPKTFAIGQFSICPTPRVQKPGKKVSNVVRMARRMYWHQ